MKVDREAVATLVLPQLWGMSMGPCKYHATELLRQMPNALNLPVLTVSQFKRFMEVIRKLGDRVEREHDQYLRDSQRIEDKSAHTANGNAAPSLGGAVDFESLVSNASAASNGNIATVKADTFIDSSKNWEDDVWGSIFTENPAVRNRPC